MRQNPKQRSHRPKSFFSREEERAIVEAIAAAERQTSGEIRIHLEHHGTGDVYERAKAVFEQLGMTQTEQRNGVLIYFATADHQFALLGDRGIHEHVGDDFWREIVEIMQENFRAGGFVLGMTLAIARIGEQLALHFPHDARADRNELSDEISRGGEA